MIFNLFRNKPKKPLVTLSFYIDENNTPNLKYIWNYKEKDIDYIAASNFTFAMQIMKNKNEHAYKIYRKLILNFAKCLVYLEKDNFKKDKQMNWEKSFDEKFTSKDCPECSTGCSVEYILDDIKQFITEEIKKAKEEAIEEYKSWLQNKF